MAVITLPDAPTKPRVWSSVWETIGSEAPPHRVWSVCFVDSCGCEEEERFSTWRRAFRFALHIAGGGDRWEFTA